MYITPEICRAAYDYLRVTPPFKRWGLPVGEEVKIIINRSNTTRAECFDGPDPKISVSEKLVTTSEVLIETLAHEMIHIYLNRKKVKAAHGKDFQKAADRVCKQHGFNRSIF